MTSACELIGRGVVKSKELMQFWLGQLIMVASTASNCTIPRRDYVCAPPVGNLDTLSTPDTNMVVAEADIKRTAGLRRNKTLEAAALRVYREDFYESASV